MKQKFLFQTALLAALVLLMFGCKNGKEHQKEIDQDAVSLLHVVGENVRSLDSKSFTLTVDEEKEDSTGAVTKTHSVNTVKAVKSNKLFVDHKQDNRNFNYWYDGEYFTYYSEDENNYVRLEAPATTAELIDEMHSMFDFKFPAGDFFYPSLKEDFDESFYQVKKEDPETIDGTSYSKIGAESDSLSVEILVSEKTSLPKALRIVNKKKNNLKYEAVFSDWNTTDSLSDSTFAYSVPENAHLIQIMSKY